MQAPPPYIEVVPEKQGVPGPIACVSGAQKRTPQRGLWLRGRAAGTLGNPLKGLCTYLLGLIPSELQHQDSSSKNAKNIWGGHSKCSTMLSKQNSIKCVYVCVFVCACTCGFVRLWLSYIFCFGLCQYLHVYATNLNCLVYDLPSNLRATALKITINFCGNNREFIK